MEGVPFNEKFSSPHLTIPMIEKETLKKFPSLNTSMEMTESVDKSELHVIELSIQIEHSRG